MARHVMWYAALYHVANASLDLTIQRIGRVIFEQHLEKFLQALIAADEMCTEETQFPCSAGRHQPLSDLETGCL